MAGLYETELDMRLEMLNMCADIVFLACLNLNGLYVRYVRDVSMRRGFLDKRGCIETTYRLKHEKDQEVLTTQPTP